MTCKYNGRNALILETLDMKGWVVPENKTKPFIKGPIRAARNVACFVNPV